MILWNEENDTTQTPVEKIGDIWVKREDTFSVNGAFGGKARTAWKISQGSGGLVTAGSRHSPQISIVSRIAERLSIPCRCHVPQGSDTPEIEDALLHGAEVIRHKAGYNSVIVKRAKDDYLSLGEQWKEIPFGMECIDSIHEIKKQVKIPPGAKRVIVPVGSGMSLSGVLWGLLGNPIPVIGIVVGANPTKRLDKYAPIMWRTRVKLQNAGVPYGKEIDASVGGLLLDPVYEAKVVKFLEPGDLFWVVGIRNSILKKNSLIF